MINAVLEQNLFESRQYYLFVACKFHLFCFNIMTFYAHYVKRVLNIDFQYLMHLIFI